MNDQPERPSEQPSPLFQQQAYAPGQSPFSEPYARPQAAYPAQPQQQPPPYQPYQPYPMQQPQQQPPLYPMHQPGQAPYPAPPYQQQVMHPQQPMPPMQQVPPFPPQQPWQGQPAQPPYPVPGYQQQPQQYPPGQAPVIMQNFYQGGAPAPTVVQVNIKTSSPNFLLRAIWFIFIGWWAGFALLNLGFALIFTVFLIPVGLVLLNYLPTVLTLRPRTQQTSVTVNNGMVTVNIGQKQQYNFLLRAVYFVFVGWWAGYCWAVLGYVLCTSILLMPVGLMMLNRLPEVLTLRRN